MAIHMSIINSSSIILMLATLCGFVSPMSSHGAQKIVFSGGAPLDSYQPRVIIPILTEAFRREGVVFIAEYNPSLRSLIRSNSGVVDGELHRVYNFHLVSNGEYPNLLRIDSQLLSIWVTAFAIKDIKISSWADLKNYRVAYYRGRKNVEKYLSVVMPSENIKTVNNDKQAFRLLSNDRTDVVISESIEGNNIIKRSEKFNNIREISHLDETKIYAYIHVKHKNLADKLALTLEKMKTDGTFKQLLHSSAK